MRPMACRPAAPIGIASALSCAPTGSSAICRAATTVILKLTERSAACIPMMAEIVTWLFRAVAAVIRASETDLLEVNGAFYLPFLIPLCKETTTGVLHTPPPPVQATIDPLPFDIYGPLQH